MAEVVIAEEVQHEENKEPAPIEEVPPPEAPVVPEEVLPEHEPIVEQVANPPPDENNQVEVNQ